MQTTDEIPRTYEEAERLLARWQGEGGPADLLAFAFSDPADETVRLLYVSEEFPESGAIYAMTFGRSPEIPFRSSTASATPQEWEQVQAGELLLPQGWELARKRQVWP
jgi:hypothetical protein